MSRSSVDSRRLAILKKIQAEDEVKVDVLAKEFGLSLMTVRRDLQYLEDHKLITRFYGGASARLAPTPMTEEEEIQVWRSYISQYAARFIADGDTLFINGSRTALDMLHYVQGQRVLVHTNNGWAVSQTYPHNVSVVMTGGALNNHVMVGETAMRNLLNLTANKTFIGCATLTETGEFGYNIPTEIGINEAMILRTTGELYILADHTKLKTKHTLEHNYGSCMYDRSWTLITDEKADPKVVENLRALGKTVIVVGMGDLLV